MYGCQIWNIKKVECQGTDAFELWCWRRFLRVPWTARRANQSILKEISSEYSLEGLMLKLKLQYFGHLMRRMDSFEKTLMLGKIEGRRRREILKAGGEGEDRGWDGWMASPTQWTWVWVSSGSWWWTGKPGVLQSMGSQKSDTTEQLNWTPTTTNSYMSNFPGASVVKNLPANATDIGSIPGSGRSPGEGDGNPLQYSCLGNPTDGGVWRATVHGIAKESDVT